MVCGQIKRPLFKKSNNFFKNIISTNFNYNQKKEKSN